MQQLINKKRIKYDDIESNKYYYLRINLENEITELYILVKEKGKSQYEKECICYYPVKVRNDNMDWVDCNIQSDDDDIILTKKEINSRSKEIMIFEPKDYLIFNYFL
jgi:hypothetical protein